MHPAGEIVYHEGGSLTAEPQQAILLLPWCMPWQQSCLRMLEAAWPQ